MKEMENLEEALSLSTEVSVKIGDRSYKIEIPTIGQLITIERTKINLTGDTHRSMLFSSTLGGSLAYVSVEAISTFSVLIPQLKKDMQKESLTDLNPKEILEIIKQYKDVVMPWLDSWRNVLNIKEDSKEVDKA